MSVTYKVRLEEDDLLLLKDKSKNEEVIKFISQIELSKKFRKEYCLSDVQSKFVTDLLRELDLNGVLIFRKILLHSCKYSNKSVDYVERKRSTKYHTKGSLDYDKPLMFRGIEFAKRFIIIKDSAFLGCSEEFWDEIKDVAYLIFKDIDPIGEISKDMFNEESKYKKWDNMMCVKCHWEGHEGLLGLLPCLIGNGKYRGKCPNCSSKNIIKKVDGFTIVKNDNNETNGTKGVTKND